MSRNYSSTNQSFFHNESRLRSLIHSQIEQFFHSIKVELERKIKSIDGSILEIHQQIAVIGSRLAHCEQLSSTQDSKKDQQLTCQCEQLWQDNTSKIKEINAKVDDIEKYKAKEINKIWEELVNYAPRREKSPLFRKSNGSSPNLNSIIFGQENPNPLGRAPALTQTSIQTFLSRQQQPQERQSVPPISKPPLPKQKQTIGHSHSQPHPILKQQISQQISQCTYTEPPAIKQAEKTHLSNQHQASGVRAADTSPHEQSDVYSGETVHQLNKNKNSFMRKKSLKKFNTIVEEDVEQSMLSTQ